MTDKGIWSDWSVELDTNQDPSGNWIITGLNLHAKTARAKSLGLTTSILRQIKINELLEDYFADQEWVEEQIMLSHPDLEESRKEWLESIKGQWVATGVKSHPEWMYARVAFFFVLVQRENMKNPISKLAELLEVETKTASRRVDKARQLGLLTRPVRAKENAPSGKSGGVLTDKAKEILGFSFKTKAKK